MAYSSFMSIDYYFVLGNIYCTLDSAFNTIDLIGITAANNLVCFVYSSLFHLQTSERRKDELIDEFVKQTVSNNND